MVWTVVVFLVIGFAPAKSAHLESRLPVATALGLSLYCLLYVWRVYGQRIRTWLESRRELLVKWEFWPAWFFYPPVALMIAALGIRHRSFSLPAVANLNQKNGGIIGESKIELPIAYDGAELVITFDPRYVADFLRVLEPEQPLKLELVDSESAAVFRTEDGYTYIVMPLSRER